MITCVHATAKAFEERAPEEAAYAALKEPGESLHEATQEGCRRAFASEIVGCISTNLAPGTAAVCHLQSLTRPFKKQLKEGCRRELASEVVGCTITHIDPETAAHVALAESGETL